MIVYEVWDELVKRNGWFRCSRSLTNDSKCELTTSSLRVIGVFIKFVIWVSKMHKIIALTFLFCLCQVLMSFISISSLVKILSKVFTGAKLCNLKLVIAYL